MTLHANLAALASSAQAWEEASEKVRGANKSLADVDASLLGDRVAGAARSFIDTWMTEIKRLQTTAGDHGDALGEASMLYHQADTDALDRSRQLLTWTDRDVSPLGGL